MKTTRPSPATLQQRFKLSPSDFGFLWEECTHCFYEKVHGRARPDGVFPSVFNRIDGAMRGFYAGKTTAWVSPTLPSGRLDCTERFIQSADIVLPGHEATAYVSGKHDCLVYYDDGTYGVVDFKTTNHSEASVRKYGRQLWAYAYCFEHPAPPTPPLAPVTHLGLLCVQPREMLMLIGEGPSALFAADPLWKPCPVDEAAFLAFVDEVLTVLERAEAPASNPRCAFCAYRERRR